MSLSSDLERPRETDRGRAPNYSARAGPSRPQQPFRWPLRFLGGLERPFRAPLWLREVLQQPFRDLCGTETSFSSCDSEAASSGDFERPCVSKACSSSISGAIVAPNGLERPFRAPSGCGAVDNGVFEAMLRRPRLRPSRRGDRRKFEYLYIYIYTLHPPHLPGNNNVF